jgi:diguanylate cyclase (GGDEF)-like protein
VEASERIGLSHGWARTGRSTPADSVRRSGLVALAVGAVYVLLARYVIWLNDPVDAGAGFWPAAGVTVAALLLIPTRHWWMVVAVVGPAELAVDLLHGYPAFAAVCWALANVVEPLVGAWIVRRYAAHDGRLVPVCNVLVFVGGAAIVAPAIAAAVGGFGTVTEFGLSWAQVWPKWVVGDGLGVLVMAPPILSWKSRQLGARTMLERAAVALLVLVGALVAFQDWSGSWDVVLPYLTLPALVWAAVRFGVRGAALAGLATAHIANLATARGFAPLSQSAGSDTHAITVLQVFVFITVVTALLLASLASDLTEGQEVERLLAYQAAHDHLTALPNRMQLYEQLPGVLSRASPQRSVAVLFLDLDKFKVVNDSLGHGWGDVLLVEIAARLSAAARPRDLVARLGGDEFVVVCDDLHEPAEAHAVARRMIAAVAEPLTHQGRTVTVSTTVGIATTTSPATTAEEMLRNADTAMYRAKRDGGGSLAFFDETLHTRAVRRLDLEIELRHSLTRGDFLVRYQPIVTAGDHEMTAVEALVRWRHPTRGLLEPAEFLDVAEDAGLIAAIGDQVITEALQQLAGSPRHDLCIAINVSAGQLRNRSGPPLHELLVSTCSDLGIAPGRVWVELTENALFDHADARRALVVLKAHGFQLVLDDFGTGYASLAQIEELPLDVVKIDRSFVARLDQRADASDRLGSIVALIHAFGMKVVIEGVETTDHERLVQLMGADLLQGFLLARPAEWEDIVSEVADRA